MAWPQESGLKKDASLGALITSLFTPDPKCHSTTNANKINARYKRTFIHLTCRSAHANPHPDLLRGAGVIPGKIDVTATLVLWPARVFAQRTGTARNTDGIGQPPALPGYSPAHHAFHAPSKSVGQLPTASKASRLPADPPAK